MRFVIVALLLWCTAALPAAAQDGVWVQVEAQPTLSSAQDRVRDYDARLPDVSGYYLGGGWYGIVLGPYSRADASVLLRQLRQRGAIPGDSFIEDGRGFREQFWPVGVGAATTAQPLPGTLELQNPEPPAPAPVIAEADETPRQARASEALLSRPEKELLQVALQWAGFYTSTIDGAFGRGTRRAMGEWQVANNHEATGILTTAQRAELLGQYNAVLDGMDLQLVRDNATGIEILIPTGVVEFARYDAPFARFDATGDLPVQVLLISQPGDQTRLFGLYEILQTLEIFPTNGRRERRERSFVIHGVDARVHSYARVVLEGGTIKGYILVWPAGDEDRRARIQQEMTQSFRTIEGVLDPALSQPGEDQAIDLVSGLAVRQPQLSRSGVFITSQGAVLTTTEVLGECDSLTIDTVHEAEVVFRDDRLGLAVLAPQSPLAPIGIAAFQTSVPRLQSEVAVAGYPYGGVLITPALTFGRLMDIRGLNGEDEVKRLALAAGPGDAGGPVFDNGGAVLGMLLPRSDDTGRLLPPDVNFSVDADQIIASLDGAGITVDVTDTLAFMPPETLTRRAAEQTVLVSCW